MAEREAGFISKARLETLARMSTPAELDRALTALWPKVVSYVISFVVVGNILFLLCVSFLPFSAACWGSTRATGPRWSSTRRA